MTDGANEPQQPSNEVSVDRRVLDLVAEYHRRVATEPELTAAKFVTEHPEHARELGKYFANNESDEEGSATNHTVIATKTFLTSEETVINRGDVAEESVSAAEPDALPSHFGRYRIKRELGCGAMGAVYLAVDEQLNREVALKIPKFDVDVDSENLERFYREARSAATLRHPGICPVFDVGELDGQHYITMAYIKGRPLRDFTKSSKRQSSKQTARVIRKVALAMADAHEQNVIHRDLKPANVMIDKKGEPVVMDFGLARQNSEDEQQLTRTGTVIGTPAYMSPEQVDGDNANVGPPADIYSLGVIFYELLAGELPFKGNLMSILNQIATKAPKPPGEVHSDIDTTLESLCLQMLAKDANQRPASMESVASELSAWLQGKNAATNESAMMQTSRVAGKKKKRPKEVKATKPTPPTAAEEEPITAVPALKEPTHPAAKKRTSRSSGPPQNRKSLLAGATAAATLLIAAVLLFFRTPYGTLRVEINDPDIEVRVKGEDIFLTNADEKEISLKAGDHTLVVTRGDFTFETTQLVLKKNEVTTVKVDLLPGKIQVVNAGNVIGEKMVGTEPVVNDQPRPIHKITAQSLGLEFSRDDLVEVPSLKLNQKGPITIEALLTWEGLNGESVLAGVPGGFAIKVQEKDHAAVRWDADKENDAFLHVVKPGDRLHLAAVYTGTKILAFVDGKLITTIEDPAVQWPDKSFMIGYRFLGNMKAVRVSSIARYETDFTPAQQMAADKGTLALYHFNEGTSDVFKDSSGNGHHGKIVEAKWVKGDGVTVAPREGADNALKLSGKNSQVTANLHYDPAKPLTMEGYFKVSANCPSNCSLAYLPQIQIQISHSKYWASQALHEGAPVVVDEWVHLAAVVTGSEERLYVNGRLVHKSPLSDMQRENMQRKNVPEKLLLCFAARVELDEFRLSQTARYDADFTPAKRFEPDEQTLALYHCDEVSGDVLRDSSGNEQHGEIDMSDAKWVLNDNSHLLNALKFDGESLVRTDDFQPWTRSEYTIEAIFSADELWGIPVHTKIGSIDLSPGYLNYKHHTGDEVAFFEFPTQRMVHVAGVYDDGIVRLFVDGKQIGPGKIPKTKMGLERIDLATHFKGVISEVRISSVARYQSDFAPPGPADRLKADENTFALYHFEDGAGDVLKDSSGNGHHGKIIGAKWVGSSHSISEILTSPDYEWTKPVRVPFPNDKQPHDSVSISGYGDWQYLYFDAWADGSGSRDIFVADRSLNGKSWGVPTLLPGPLNERTNEESCSVSADGLLMVFHSDRPGGQGGQDLWIAERKSTQDRFETVVNLGNEINTDSIEADPTISGDGLTLVWNVKIRDDVETWYDLWSASRTNRKERFKNPIWLGPDINTKAVEKTPWLSPDGNTLLFARQGPNGEFYICTRSSPADSFGPAKSFGRELDTSAEELSPRFSSDGKTFYFSSRRESENNNLSLWMAQRVRKDSSVNDVPRESVDAKPVVTVRSETATPRGSDVEVKIERRSSLDGHQSRPSKVAFSPDGTTIAASGDDNIIKMWNARTGEETKTLETDHTKGIRQLAFSPDGTSLATCSEDGTVKTWEIESGKNLFSDHAPDLVVLDVAFSPDGSQLACGLTGYAALWDVTSGKQLHRFANGEEVSFVAFSPDGSKVITTSSFASKTVRVWSVDSGKETLGFESPKDCVGMTVHPVNGTIVSGLSDDKSLAVWDPTTGSSTRTLTIPRPANALAFNPDGSILAGGDANAIILWRFSDGIKLVEHDEHDNFVTSLDFSPDGKMLVVARKTVEVWDVFETPPTDAPPLSSRDAIDLLLKRKAYAIVMKDGERIYVTDSSQVPAPPFEIRGIFQDSSLTQKGSITDTDCKLLAQIKTIDELNLSGAEATMVGFSEFASSENVLSVSVPRTTRGATAIQNAAAITQSFPNLKFVHLPHYGGDDFLKAIRGNASLAAISLYRTIVTQQSLADLATFPNLRYVAAYDANFRKAELEKLADLPNLEHLGISLYTGMAIEELAPLKNISSLKTVVVRSDDRKRQAECDAFISKLLPNCRHLDFDKFRAEPVRIREALIGFDPKPLAVKDASTTAAVP